MNLDLKSPPLAAVTGFSKPLSERSQLIGELLPNYRLGIHKAIAHLSSLSQSGVSEWVSQGTPTISEWQIKRWSAGHRHQAPG